MDTDEDFVGKESFGVEDLVNLVICMPLTIHRLIHIARVCGACCVRVYFFF